MHRERVRWTRAFVAAAVTLGAMPASAQVAERFLQGLRESALALRNYEWKSRTEVRRGGEPRSEQLFLVRYGLDGALQTTRLGGTPPPDTPRHPLRKRIAERKTREYQELVSELGTLAQSYSSLPPDRLQALLGSANVVTPLSRTPDSIRVEVKDVLQRGDSLNLWIDPVTHQQQRAEVGTFLDGKPVTVASEFRRLPDGPTYLARVVVEYPSEGLQLITDNFDHKR